METKTMSFRDTIILAMSEEMRRDENVFLMGEDVGVFGGDFELLSECSKNLVQNVSVTVRFLKLPSLEQQRSSYDRTSPNR